MHIGFYNFYEFYNKNRMFNDSSSPIGDDLVYPYVYLAEYAKQRNIKVSTIDMEDISSYNSIVFLDFPTFRNKYFCNLIKNKFPNLYLVILESVIHKPDNWNMSNHKYFRKIFTWNDNFIDNKKYIKINYAQKVPINLEFDLKDKQKLCVMIAGNKFEYHPLELYSERIKAIRWFEKNNPQDFDLYGIGWDRYYFRGIFKKINRLYLITKLFRPTYHSYKGQIKSKRDVLKNYKFSICYENIRDIPGYITEKIFDCFFAGCVPVYLGAPNIIQHIPPNCFIDKRNYKTYEELYSYMKNMQEKEYMGYLEAIKNFIYSKRFYPFSVECFVKTLLENVIEDNNEGKFIS